MPHRNGRVGNRAVLVPLVREMRSRTPPLTHREIAVRLNISRSYANALDLDPDGLKEQARKASYAQPCMDCGAPTSGSEGRKDEPRCSKCSAIHWGASNMKWPEERVIESIQWWFVEFGEPPSATDWNATQARKAHHNEERALRFERLHAEGKVPWFNTVIERFGTFNKGVIAAGFVPRSQNGSRENNKRLRSYKNGKLKPYWIPSGKGITMDALVLRKNGSGWVEVGTTEARSYQDAVENVATEPGEYIAVPSSQVFVLAPVTKLAATVKSA